MNNQDNKTAIQSVLMLQMLAASNMSLLASTLLAAILAYMQQDVIDFPVVLGWFSLIAIVMLARVALVMAYQHSPADDGAATHARLVRFRLGVLAAGAVWGSAGFLLFPTHHPQHQMFLIFALAGLTAGGVVSYSADLVSGIVFSVSALAPLVIRLLVAGDSLSLAMAVALMLYLGFMIMSLRHNNRNIYENIALRLEAVAHEKTVQASEERYRLLLSHSPVGIFHYDANLVITYCNDYFAEMLHNSVERIIGLDMKHLKDQSALPTLRKTLEGENAYYEGHYSATFSDASGWAAMTCASLRDGKGKIAGGIAIVQDISGRKRLEQQLSRRLHHRDAMERITRISLGSTNVEELLGRVLGEMQTLFNADRVWFLYPCDPDAPSWSVPMERTRPEWPGAFARGMVMPMTPETAEVFREVLASTKPLAYGPAADRHIPAAVAGQFSIRSQIQMALRPRVGSPWAMGLHHCAQAHAYDEDDLLLFHDIGRRVADALSSMIMLKNLRESENKFRMLFEEMVSGFALHEIVFDENGKPADYITLEVNREFERLLGTTRENVIGKKAYETVPGLDRKWLEIFGKVALTGAPSSYEEYASNLGKWFAGTVFSPQKGLVAGTFIDITERKRAGDALRESESRYRLLVESSPFCIHEIDLEGRLLSMNRAGLDMLCMEDADKIRGVPCLGMVSQQDAGCVGTLLRDAIANGTTSHFEFASTGDAPMHFKSCFIPIKDAGGKVLKLMGISEDITERKHAEGKLWEKNQLLDSIVENIPNTIFLKRASDLRYALFNRAGEALVGRSRDELLGRNDYDFFPKEQADFFTRKDRAALEQNGIVDIPEEPVETARGTRILHTRKLALRDEHGQPQYLLGISDDITERKEFEEELKRSNAELEQFSYAISHDMRQPLRMISSYLQLIEMSLASQLDGEKRNYFNFAIEGAKRIDQMLVALLEYSRVGRMGEPPAWIDSREALDEALQFLQPVLSEAQAKVNIAGDWPRALVRHDEILRLLQNLIGNAAKFRVAGRAPEITVSSEAVRNEWRLSVADNGVGIIPGQIKRLFQVFQRLQLRTAYEGNGVGLALCRKIAEHHKGRIWAESAGEGKGSKFCVVLPVLRGEHNP